MEMALARLSYAFQLDQDSKILRALGSKRIPEGLDPF